MLEPGRSDRMQSPGADGRWPSHPFPVERERERERGRERERERERERGGREKRRKKKNGRWPSKRCTPKTARAPGPSGREGQLPTP
eukprot:2588777-Pyramimonas_sp.AAC.1